MSKAKKPDKEIIEKYLELQAQTPCMKCKKKDWTQDEGYDLAQGGDKVGKFVVLGSPNEVVNVGTFTCKACGAKFSRPFYSREQLAAQEYPAITLDVRAADPPPKAKTVKKTKSTKTDPNLN